MISHGYKIYLFWFLFARVLFLTQLTLFHYRVVALTVFDPCYILTSINMCSHFDPITSHVRFFWLRHVIFLHRVYYDDIKPSSFEFSSNNFFIYCVFFCIRFPLKIRLVPSHQECIDIDAFVYVTVDRTFVRNMVQLPLLTHESSSGKDELSFSSLFIVQLQIEINLGIRLSIFNCGNDTDHSLSRCQT